MWEQHTTGWSATQSLQQESLWYAFCCPCLLNEKTENFFFLHTFGNFYNFVLGFQCYKIVDLIGK